MNHGRQGAAGRQELGEGRSRPREDEMSEESNKNGVRRRGFLGGFAGIASAAAALVVSRQAVTPAVAQETDDEKRKTRYQETDHVKAFYRTNRY